MIALTPKRTRLILRIRRLITALQRKDHPNWPDATIQTVVNRDMLEVSKMPIRKVRLVARTLNQGLVA
jgi:endonuclease YncB( thermonuclease family)